MPKPHVDEVMAPAPRVPEAEILALLRNRYALTAPVIRELVSERDQNFLVESDGERFVFKVANAGEPAEVTDFQVQALGFLEGRSGSIDVPCIRQTGDGSASFIVDVGGVPHRARLVSWVDGDLLDDCALSPALAESFGEALAELNLSLDGFRHPAENQDIPWNMRNASRLRRLMSCIDDADAAGAVEAVLDDFDANVVSRYEALRQRVIHNDANPNNVVVRDGRVVGFIDFGDMVHAPVVVDVAVAGSYLRTRAPDPMQLIAPLVEGFHRRQPLDPAELDLVYDLTRTRLAMTITLLYWRMSARPADDPYRVMCLGNEADALGFLRQLNATPRQAFRAQLPATGEKI